jgi:hypothetical protein
LVVVPPILPDARAARIAALATEAKKGRLDGRRPRRAPRFLDLIRARPQNHNSRPSPTMPIDLSKPSDSATPRFASLAAGGLSLESARAANGEPEPLEYARALQGEAKSPVLGRWTRKAANWAFRGSLMLGLGALAAAGVLLNAPDLASSLASVPGDWRGHEQIAQAQAAWNWAAAQGFYEAKTAPQIGNFDPRASVDDNAGRPEALSEFTVQSGQATPVHVERIQMSKSAARLGVASSDPAEDVKIIVWHESWHADTDLAPNVVRFGASSVHGEALSMIQAAAWALSVEGLANLPPSVRGQLNFGRRNLYGMYREASADAAAFIIAAHAMPKEQWNAMLIHAEGFRASSMTFQGSGDVHETQEALQILAALGHDKIAALSPAQSRLLADAVGADNVVLAARKQGWEHDIYFLAENAATLSQTPVNKISKSSRWFFENITPSLRGAAAHWASLGHDARVDANLSWIAQSAQWERGARLDYSSIAPGLVATLGPHAPRSSYETLTGGEDPGTPLYGPQSDPRTSRQGLGALAEWKDVARSLGVSDSAALRAQKPFKQFSAMLDEAGQNRLADDPFWTPDPAAMKARLARQRAQEAALDNPPAAPAAPRL